MGYRQRTKTAPAWGFWVWVGRGRLGCLDLGEDQAAPSLLTAQSVSLFVSQRWQYCYGIASGPTTRSYAKQMTVGWGRPFDEPIDVAGRRLVTLLDAGEYIAALPKKEHNAPEWQAAMEALLLVAEGGGPTMFARIGVLRALNRHYVPEFNPKGTEPHWGRRKLERDQ